MGGIIEGAWATWQSAFLTQEPSGNGFGKLGVVHGADLGDGLAQDLPLGGDGLHRQAHIGGAARRQAPPQPAAGDAAHPVIEDDSRQPLPRADACQKGNPLRTLQEDPCMRCLA